MRYIEKNSHVGKKKVFENQRLVARKTYGLSRRQQRFKSAWGRQQKTEGASLYPENQGLVVRLLYYKHPALVKPSPKAFKPSRPLHVCSGLAPSGRFYLRASSLKISLLCEETDRKAVLLALVISALCICGLASPLPARFRTTLRSSSRQSTSPSRRTRRRDATSTTCCSLPACLPCSGSSAYPATQLHVALQKFHRAEPARFVT